MRQAGLQNDSKIEKNRFPMMMSRAVAVLLLLGLLRPRSSSLPPAPLASAKPLGSSILREVHVDLAATWNATSVVHEAAEWLGDGRGDPRKFYAFAEAMMPGASGVRESQGCWARLHGAMDSLVGGQLRQVGKVALASRQYSPRLETFRQMSTASDPGEGTCCWAVVNGGVVVTDPLEVGAELEKAKAGTREETGSERVLDIDHLWVPKSGAISGAGSAGGDGAGAPTTIVLYGPMDSSCSAAMHEAIIGAVGTSGAGSDATYMWRPIPFRATACGGDLSCAGLGAGGPLIIPGYGVELALKSTEYNAQDDSADKAGDKGPDGGQRASNPEKLEIRLSSFENIGKHVLEKISGTDDALGVLEDITGDFPSIVDAMAEVPVSEETSEAVEWLASKVVPDAKLLLINGVAMDSQDMSWHGILETLRAESEFMETLHELGISPDVVPALVTKRVTKGSDATDIRLDYRPTDEVLWLSDVEEDEMFEGMSSDINDYLRKDFMGQRQMVRRNLFTGIMLVDPSTRAGLAAIATASGLLRQGFPVKIGLVPVGSRNKDLATAFVATALESGGRAAADVFAGAAARVSQGAWKDEESFAAAVDLRIRNDPRVVFPTAPNEVKTDDQNAFLKIARSLLEGAAEAVERLGVDLGKGRVDAVDDEESDDDGDVGAALGDVSGALMMNGVVHRVASPSMWQSVFVSVWQAEGETLAELVEAGALSNESSDLYGDIVKALGAVPRYNPRIIKEQSGLGIDAIVEDPHVEIPVRDVRALLEALDGDDVEYLHDGKSGVPGPNPVPVTHWVFVSSKDDPLVEEARRASASGTLRSSRIGITMLDSGLSRLLNVGDRPGVLTNGRFLRARFVGDITSGDFLLLEEVARKEMHADDSLMEAATHSISSPLGLSPVSIRKASDLAAVLSSVMASYHGGRIQPEAMALLDDARAPTRILKRSKFGFPTAPLRIRALFAPLSPAGQQLAPILAFIHESFHADIDVVLNVRSDYSDLPLKSYYRYVTPGVLPEVDDSDDVGTDSREETSGDRGHEVFWPRAVIPSLPLRDILTLGMDVPEAWLVSVVRSKHDLDNLQLGSIDETNVVASFSLDSILFTGMALDVQRMSHPRGVQLELKSMSSHNSAGDEIVTDTLVMRNLGYFQLKANPGLWRLLLAEGASRDIYNIKEIRQGLQTYGDGRDGVPVASFAGSHVFLLLERNKGHAGRSVWEAELGGDQASAKSMAVGGKPPGENHQADDMIHVFTVASGHMYERLQKIMILSAVKRSSRKLKFWFISNSISNQHREFIPIMASQYGFEYEFITFKWPTWLHKQTDKQRIIWAYKILFLDVMFPLGLKKVIFCDSDQVIRADLAELWDLDLGGKPYGYVPMCGGNGEDDMDRFRFWKTGYWQEHLRGLPYHISALYVVDLQRFRAMAAGDHLRVVYDNLAKVRTHALRVARPRPSLAHLRCPPKCRTPTRFQTSTRTSQTLPSTTSRSIPCQPSGCGARLGTSSVAPWSPRVPPPPVGTYSHPIIAHRALQVRRRNETAGQDNRPVQ